MFAQFRQMLDNQIRLRRAQLFQRVVAGQHGTGMHAAMLSGLDVMFHVADEQRFIRLKIVFGEDLVDFFALVPNIHVRFFEKYVKAGNAALDFEMVGVDGAQEKRAEFFGTAKFQKFARMWQFGHGSLRTFEFGVKPVFKLRHRHVRRVAVVKLGEWQRKLRAELFQRHLRPTCLRQNKIRGLQDGGQIVHQSPGPVEDDVADHKRI